MKVNNFTIVRFVFYTLFTVFFGTGFAQNNRFESIDKAKITSGILIDMIKKPNPDFEIFTGNENKEPIRNAQWRQLYTDIQNASLLNKLPNLSAVKTEINTLQRSYVFPVSVLNFEYQKIKQQAWTNGEVFVKDGQIRTISDDIYETRRLFAASVTQQRTYTSLNPTFRFGNSFFYSNQSVLPVYLNVNFDDGTGFHKLDLNSEYQAEYKSNGTKMIQLRAVFQDGKTLKSDFNFEVKSSTMPVPTEVWSDYTADLPYMGDVAVGDVGVFLGNGNTDFRRPVILVDGFDPGDSRQLEEIYDIANQQELMANLRAEGYDAVLVNLHGGADYIQRNAMLVVKLLQDINDRMAATGNLETVPQTAVIGPSMGGLITRYALTYMETNNIQHHVRNWISFDSPQKGANIPLGLQHWLRFFAEEAEQEEAIANLEQINTVASRQMMIYHYLSTDGTIAGQDNLRTDFVNELEAMGYPESRIIAIINGSGTAAGQGFNAEEQIVEYYLRSFTVDLDGDIYASPNQTSAQIFRGLYDTALPFDEVTEDIFVSNTLPYDGAPGGRTNSMQLLDETDTGGYGDIIAYHNNHCFIPAISACALGNTTNPYFNIEANLVSLQTPFDKLYYPTENQNHVEITPESYDWFYKEIFNYFPTFTNTAPANATEDVNYTYMPTVSDENEWNNLTISVLSKPEWLSFNGTTLGGTPTNAEVGSHEVTLQVSDGLDETLYTFSITVENQNDEPEFTSTPIIEATEDSEYQYIIEIMDIDPTNDNLTISGINTPDWLSLDGTLLYGTPTNSHVGYHNVTLSLSDGYDVVVQTFTIYVENQNDAPEFTSTPNLNATVNHDYQYLISITDIDPTADILILSTQQSPDWLSLNDNVLSGIPGEEHLGSHDVTLSVSDGFIVENQTFTITVEDNVSITESEDSVRIFPNPTTNYFTIFGATGRNIQIFNTVGKLLIDTHVTNSSQSIDISDLTKGVYILKLSDNYKTKQIRIIKN